MVAVATITWARSPDEEVTLRRSLQRLSEIGLPIAVADRGNSAPLTDFIGGLPGFDVTVPGERGLAAQVKASVTLATSRGTPFILYTEPDKEFFFGTALSGFIRQAPSDPHTGVVLASRDDQSLRTFPPMQRYTEGVVNHLCGEMLGCSGDYCYGPFLMNRAMACVIADLPANLGWGWRPFVFRAAKSRGLRVTHITSHFPCPPEGLDEDDNERKHRMRQLSENVLGLIASTDPS